jgi:RHH-type proline utilization regulon transcriptional repressor/proline dehydrogenase/delta 1-pyrroline-5-carboxylate dehydrogenase
MLLKTLRDSLRQQTHADEAQSVDALMNSNALSSEQAASAQQFAVDIIDACRANPDKLGPFDSFMQEYNLSSQEGVALMCLAEALLRVPDAKTIDRFIAEKFDSRDWKSHLGKSKNMFVNAATWGMILTGKIVRVDTATEGGSSKLQKLIKRIGAQAVRIGVMQAMKVMGCQYVLGRNISEAINRGNKENVAGTRFSFDMLGEGARTFDDAKKYFDAYMNAIVAIGEHNTSKAVFTSDGISIKLTALHPRYEFSHREQVIEELLPLVVKLALEAKKHNMGFTIDAEEADRLDIELDIFQALALNPLLNDWDGLGFVLQAYQKRAVALTDWLVELAKSSGRRLMVRLVKGAYWDSEIKHAQEQGFVDYPVFTRKAHTDLSYQVCAAKLLAAREFIFPQFATHNAYTVAMLVELAIGEGGFEFQRLHGMGELLYSHVHQVYSQQEFPLRVYAPVGNHRDLLPYLVRRLLENGANGSFVNQFLSDSVPAKKIAAIVEQEIARTEGRRHSMIPKPKDIFTHSGELRNNSDGIDLDDLAAVEKLQQLVEQIKSSPNNCGPIINGETRHHAAIDIVSPSDNHLIVGQCSDANADDVADAIAGAKSSQPGWQARSVSERADILDAAANMLEKHMYELTALISVEAGRIFSDGISEVREAVDFCRYYALQARKLSAQYPDQQGLNEGRGVFVCISPWNFPLAIFIGQIAAALAVGNSVIAKPSEQTPLIACRAIKFLHQAGVPVEVLQFLPGRGSLIGPLLMNDPATAGVAFTGSTVTAKNIQKNLINRGDVLPPLIAETGGQNVMLVDSSALPEQVVDDVIQSAFLSAGQRCSALRVLYLQEDIADTVLTMLKGAMAALNIGPAWQLSTDIGPVIDHSALQKLQQHVEKMTREATLLAKTTLPATLASGSYMEPHAFELDHISQLTGEVFGPILHVIRYKSADIHQVIADINATGYGLTLGVHSRISGFAEEVFKQTRVGNTYINRNVVGAVVGVNPFGGQGLSGTGFKAGGPHYLLRFTALWSAIPTAQSVAKAKPLATTSASSDTVIEKAKSAQPSWDACGGKTRSVILGTAIKNLEAIFTTQINGAHLQGLLSEAETHFEASITLPGPTGEVNSLSLHGRGVFLCSISQQHLSRSIQYTIAALAAGNSVILIAASSDSADIATSLEIANCLQACVQDGVVVTVIDSAQLSPLIGHNDIAGVATCGAKFSASALADRAGAIIPLVTAVSDCFPLHPFAVEKTKTNNVVATGGNTLLLNLIE